MMASLTRRPSLMSIARPIASLLLVMAAASAAATEVDGHTVPDAIQLSGHPLLLNGAALRRFAIFKVEVAALYLTEKATSLEAVNAADGPKSLRLLMLRDVSNGDLNRKFMSDLRAVASTAELEALAPGIAALDAMFRGFDVRKGDVISLDWLPGQGLVVTRNGTALGSVAISSERLYGVVLRIFLGPKADEEARDRLLGLKAAKQ